MADAMASSSEVWHAHPWVIAMAGDTLHRGKYLNPDDGQRASARLVNGETPRDVFGWLGERLPAGRVRAVEWVSAASTVLVRRGWWRDPWRLVFAEPAEGEKAFRRIAALLPAAEEQHARVGPNDLAMDPRFGLGVFLAFIGLIALAGGATEGAGTVRARFRIFAELGEAIGIVPVMVIGAVAALAGLAGLVWWYLHRPTKIVVRPARRG